MESRLDLYIAPVEQPPIPPRYINIFVEGVPIGNWVQRHGRWMIYLTAPVQVNITPKEP